MGQVIRFRLPGAPYPNLAADLATAECVLLLAIRWWVQAYRSNEDPVPRLCSGLHMAGARDAAYSIDGLMAVVACAVSRALEIHYPRCPTLSRDEASLLHAASLTQAGQRDLAEKVLRDTLLSAPGAEFALGSLAGLGDLFAQARLFLSRRRSPIQGADSGDSREPWSPPDVPYPVH
jgi:hypothetical protein